MSGFLADNDSLNTDWIEHLALEELNMDESGLVSFNEHLNPTAFIEESSIDIMNRVRDLFEFFVAKFNEFRGPGQGQLIKVFKISNTINDFMLYRNSLRLVIARKANDLITIGFMGNGGEYVPPRLGALARGVESATPVSSSPHEIRAHLGPFYKVSWRFNGEEVDERALVKHYLSEFIKNSAN